MKKITTIIFLIISFASYGQVSTVKVAGSGTGGSTFNPDTLEAAIALKANISDTASLLESQARAVNRAALKLDVTGNGSKLNWDSLHVKPAAYKGDSIWFVGTSITYGTGVADISLRFPALVSSRLGAFESNHGHAGERLTVEGITAPRLAEIPIYSATKYRYAVIEWGVNDLIGAVDTTTYAAAYLRYLDTFIVRGWPASKILILSPSATAQTANNIKYEICVSTIAARRGTLYLNNYAIQLSKGGLGLFPDNIHPGNYGVSAGFVNPIVRKLGDSVRVQGQELSTNGIAEFQKVRLKNLDTAGTKTVPIGISESGDIVAYDKGSFITNNQNSSEPQGAALNITGQGKFGNIISTTEENLQVGGHAKITGVGRFMGSGSSTMLGAATEVGWLSSRGFIYAFDRSATPYPGLPRSLIMQEKGGSVGIGINTTPATSAILDINSTTQGVLFPRYTTANRTAISSPAKGLTVYDSTTNTIWTYSGTAWKESGSGATIAGANSASITKQVYKLMGSPILAQPIPDLSASGAGIYLIGARAYYGAVYLDTTMTITGVAYEIKRVGVYTENNYNGVGLFSFSGGVITLIDSSFNDGGIWKQSLGWHQTALSTGPRSLPAGLYFIGAIYSNAAQTTSPGVGGMNPNLPLNPLTTNSSKLWGYLGIQYTLTSPISHSALTPGVDYLAMCLY